MSEAAHLREIEVERYKGYFKSSALRLHPLTILVGRNNSGKSAIAQAVALLAGGLLALDGDSPLPLRSLGLVHGATLHDLIWRRSTHGNLRIAASFDPPSADESIRFEMIVQAVVSGPGEDPMARISRWSIEQASHQLSIELPDVTNDEHRVFLDGILQERPRITWRGLLPSMDSSALPGWVTGALEGMGAWARNVRYLRSPRKLCESPFRVVPRGSTAMGADGKDAPLVLASDDGLRQGVSRFFESAFDAKLDIRRQLELGWLEIRASERSISIAQTGQGLTQVLPVATMLISAPRLGAGLDVIEHPEAEIHPGAHGTIADRLLSSAGESDHRSIVVETHSEMILLRARRWIAEGRVDASDVGVYWVDSDDERGSSLSRIEITPDGEVLDWPESVFYENYEEILAIRRAARGREP